MHTYMIACITVLSMWGMLRLASIMDAEVLFAAVSHIDIHHRRYSFWMPVQCLGYMYVL